MSDVIVKMSQETFEFLRDLGRKIDAQNNRATAKPYFFVIQTEKWRVANDEYSTGETKRVWVDTSGQDEYHEWKSREEFIQNLIEHQDLSKKEAEEAAEDLKEFTMEKYIEEDNAFFTHDAFKRHVELNGHNLGRRGEYYDYLKHAFRNPEMDGVFKALAEFATKEPLDDDSGPGEEDGPWAAGWAGRSSGKGTNV